jgi:hypothetical protein
MEDQELMERFSRASILDETKAGFHTPKAWDIKRYYSGVKRLKRAILGLCGTSCLRSLDELATSLHQIGMVDSKKEGKQVASNLIGECFEYGDGRELRFDRVVDYAGHIGIKVTAYTRDYSLA